jgi:hypothetical protein
VSFAILWVGTMDRHSHRTRVLAGTSQSCQGVVLEMSAECHRKQWIALLDFRVSGAIRSGSWKRINLPGDKQARQSDDKLKTLS